jgi:hypothetical protein
MPEDGPFVYSQKRSRFWRALRTCIQLQHLDVLVGDGEFNNVVADRNCITTVNILVGLKLHRQVNAGWLVARIGSEISGRLVRT